MIFDNVKVGDKFRPLGSDKRGGILTVTELTTNGFNYTLSDPYHAFPARYGPSLVTGGEVYCRNPNNNYVPWDELYERYEEVETLPWLDGG